MTIQVVLKHKTEYHFDKLVNLSPHVIRLRPAQHCRTPIQAYSLKVEPKQHFINWQQDPFGNYLARFVFPEKAQVLKIDVELIADMTVINPFDFFLEEEFETYPYEYDKDLKRDLNPYLEIREDGKLLTEWLTEVDRSECAIVDFLVGLNQRLNRDINYNVRMEPGVQTCEETLKIKSGSCRDTAWLLIQILRHLGLAARFVSGYLVQLTADVKALDGPSGPANDFTDLHAWAEVYLPGAGWVGLDPTSGLFAGEGHIPLACTPHPSTAAPVTGASDPCEVTFKHKNVVERFHEDPRVTKPFSDTQWQSVMRIGTEVDKELEEADVRLTMGGEPTFVSIDDMEGAEWNDAALGDEKRRLAEKLLFRLKDQFAAGGLVHFGQGKWYPGEPLPRWALSLIWRKDGKPVWNNQDLISSQDAEASCSQDDARKFVLQLADELELDPAYIISAYEDKQHYLEKENQLPVNVSMADSKSSDKIERKRLARIAEQGLDSIRGYVLPVKYFSGKKEDCWKTSPWPLRTDKLYLVPGDSSMGYRLPLNSLPWKLPDEFEFDTELDPFAPRDKLDEKQTRQKKGKKKNNTVADEVIHTAMCVEERDGKLYVFMPPVNEIEQWLDLVQTLEAIARKLKLAIAIEGYQPPWDTRMNMLQVTPDPGVIEVNIHPASNWEELSKVTEILYKEARETRLGTEKFMLDGKHSGTGGGNHVTLGAQTPADSPFLRRPDLLRSLITYWQHHPSLSYLFSGMFIGPTSQAPRVDEARDDNLYELEIALSLLPDGECEQPWLVDRILRNFLVDLTGNTHRAEFCIDKLYSPDSITGRKGLLEFRAFEMPPHYQMSLVQMLLLRTLIAWFWKQPYRGELIRWGTELHDRFMLPHYVWEDFNRVIYDLRQAGYPLELDWFNTFKEFRFPRIGTIFAHDMQIDLHAALEPWHVLGEESTGQGTARYVDSSVERVQLSVHGMHGDRYVLACNGRKIPLRDTGIKGKKIAGVRFKAWQPYSSLHPTIKAHVPLVFDVIDTKFERSIAGCTYHVSHPGGRNYDTFPVNGNEAEARRNSRFIQHGKTQDKVSIPLESAHPDHPYTLDLRVPVS
ncbi:MAG: transglutaminase family protein [Gammaproteobacteria bacterium]